MVGCFVGVLLFTSVAPFPLFTDEEDANLEPPRSTNVKLSPDGLLLLSIRSILLLQSHFLCHLPSRNHDPRALFTDEEDASLEPPRSTHVKLPPDGLLLSLYQDNTTVTVSITSSPHATMPPMPLL